MAIRLIASDVDATLLPNGGSISSRTRAAVRACAERGVTFTIATGRWYPTARRIVEALGQESGVMIVANGGAILDLDGNPLMEWSLDPADAAAVYRIARRYPVDLLAYARGALYWLETQNPTAHREESRTTDDGRFRYVCGDPEAFEREGLRAPYKMAVDCDDPAALAALREELIVAGLDVTSSHATNLEILSKGMGKGAAVRALAEKLGVRREEIMAFGDNTNDLDLLAAAGWPVAMGNAADALKAVARVIAPRDTEDGVAQIIERALAGEFDGRA